MIKYRSLKRWKYQLTEDYCVFVPKNGLCRPSIDTNYIHIAPMSRRSDFNFVVRKHYAWDGPSGPTIDTKSFMRGSLVHDAFYQLMREGRLDPKIWKDYADQLLRKMCIEDGMWRFRANYVYWAVKHFGGRSWIKDWKSFEPQYLP